MAGIGFELRKLLKKQTYGGLIQAYAFAGVISSGPWVLSIIGIMLIVETARLYLIFPQHDAIFIELAQSKRIRYLILLLPVAPIVMWSGSLYLRFIPAFILAFTCVSLSTRSR